MLQFFWFGVSFGQIHFVGLKWRLLSTIIVIIIQREDKRMMLDAIVGGFISKVINNGWDVSWEAIKKADHAKRGPHQDMQTRVYQIMVDVLNHMTCDRYEGQDILYSTAEKLFKEANSNSGFNDVIKREMKNLIPNADGRVCQEFMKLMYYELAKDRNTDLYKEIMIFLLNEKNKYTYREIQEIKSVLNSFVQRSNEKSSYTYEEIQQIKSNLNSLVQTLDEKNRNVQVLKNRTKEYADKWDENMFLNNFSEWDEDAGENVKLRDVYIDGHLPHFILGKNKKISSNLDAFLSEYFIRKSENQMLLILGQPGIGKSTLITWLTKHFSDRSDDIFIYKFASDLYDITWENGRVSNQIEEKLGLTYYALNSKTLILDGFDEVRIADDRRRYILDSLYDTWIYGQRDKFSLIITCREHYIKEFEEVKCRYVILQPWDEAQIRSFCNIFKKAAKINVSEYTINHLIENKSILGIPLILYMVLALNISIDQDGSMVEIYDKIFALEGGIYDRCIDNIKYGNAHWIGEREIKDQIHQMSREIAIWMFENNPEEASIQREEYEKICNGIAGENSDNLGDDFLLGNFFERVRHCEGISSEEVSFVHRSIYEYFVAEYIFSSIEESKNVTDKLAGVLGRLLKGNQLSVKMLEFLKNKFRNNEPRNFFDRLNQAFQLMIENGMTFFTYKCFMKVTKCEMNVFANMLQILHLLEYKDFQFNKMFCDYIMLNCEHSLSLGAVDLSGAKLSGAKLNRSDLSGADLREANISRVDLSGADLREADLREANISGADLSGAKLSRSKLSEANLSRSNLSGADLREADLSGADLSEAKLSRANLREAKLSKVDLSGADLSEAKLSRANLREAKLSRSNLNRINLREADLSGADLSRSNLNGANLNGTNLSGANLNGADLSKTNLNGSILYER